MHDDDDKFLRSIPPFLRRYQDPPPRKLPIRPRALPAARDQTEPQSRPAPIATPAAAPAVVPAAPAAPAAQRARIALAFENQDMAQDLAQGPAQGTAQGPAQDTAGDDVAFQVTLPLGVVRQIRTLAAEQDSSQRAVVLRALRLAGLSVPEGSDSDRPAKRQA